MGPEENGRTPDGRRRYPGTPDWERAAGEEPVDGPVGEVAPSPAGRKDGDEGEWDVSDYLTAMYNDEEGRLMRYE